MPAPSAMRSRRGGERGQCDPEVEDRVVKGKVLACPERVVAQLLGELGDGAVAPRSGSSTVSWPASLDARSSPAGPARHAFS